MGLFTNLNVSGLFKPGISEMSEFPKDVLSYKDLEFLITSEGVAEISFIDMVASDRKEVYVFRVNLLADDVSISCNKDLFLLDNNCVFKLKHKYTYELRSDLFKPNGISIKYSKSSEDIGILSICSGDNVIQINYSLDTLIALSVGFIASNISPLTNSNIFS